MNLTTALLISISCFNSITSYSIGTQRLNEGHDTLSTYDIRYQFEKVEVVSSSDSTIVVEDELWMINNDGALLHKRPDSPIWDMIRSISNDGMHPSANRFDHIDFFNSRVGVVTGYIKGSGEGVGNDKDGYYRTTDGGATWSLHSMGTSSWIYESDLLENKMWMGGSSGHLYFSDDYGANFTSILKLKNNDRIYAIDMFDENVGALSMGNRLAVTTNNWRSYHEVPGVDLEFGGDDRIKKVRFWKDYYIIQLYNQNVYYRKGSDTAWSRLEDVYSFEVEENSLFAITESGSVLYLPTIDQRIETFNLGTSGRHVNISFGAEGMYFVGGGSKLSRLNERVLERLPLYTPSGFRFNDIAHSTNVSWAIDHESLLRKDENSVWRRVAWLDSPRQLYGPTDSSIYVFDDWGNCHFFSLSDGELKIALPPLLLGEFLDYEFSSIEFSIVHSGCFHHQSYELKLTRRGDVFYGEHVGLVEGLEASEEDVEIELDADEVYRVFRELNKNPVSPPTLDEIEISEEDKEGYRSFIRTMFIPTEGVTTRRDLWSDDQELMEKMLRLPEHLDTIPAEIVRMVLQRDFGGWCTSSTQFNIRVVNENNDTLQVFHINSRCGSAQPDSPFYFPWIVRTDEDFYYDSYNLGIPELFRTVGSKIWSGEMDALRSKWLLAALAQYYVARAVRD